jgi:YidC/Oxa1 family membrane protein insertase
MTTLLNSHIICHPEPVEGLFSKPFYPVKLLKFILGIPMDLFSILFYQPIYNFLIVLYNLVGQNLGVSIILVAIIFRLLTIPLTRRQIKMSEQSRELQERTKELKNLHKNNETKLKEEQMKLQQEYLPGQLAGCLPMILQLVVFSQVYIVLQNIFKDGTASFNRVAYPFMPHFAEGANFNTNFFGLDIAQHPGLIGYNDFLRVLPYILLAVLVAVTQILSTRILMGARKKQAAAEPEKETKPRDKNEPEDFGEIMQRSTQQTMYILPLMLGFFALNFPAGLALYWTTQNAFVIIQQLIVDKLRK